MGKREAYQERLRSMPADELDAFLLAESGLPGPRGNLELAHAVADVVAAEHFSRWTTENPPELAPTNDPREFLAFCGVLGLSRAVSTGDPDALTTLRELAEDSRWRTREAVATALQRVGAEDISLVLHVACSWCSQSPLAARAAVAAVAEPALLREPAVAIQALDVLECAMRMLLTCTERREEGARVLRQALGYAWSVVVVAVPDEGRRRFEALAESTDRDVHWIIHENLKKSRFTRMDPAWVARMNGRPADA